MLPGCTASRRHAKQGVCRCYSAASDAPTLKGCVSIALTLLGSCASPVRSITLGFPTGTRLGCAHWLCTTPERRCVSLHVCAQKKGGHVSMPKFEGSKVYQSVPDDKEIKIKCKHKHVSRAQDAAGCQHRFSPSQARVGIKLRKLYRTGHLCLTTLLIRARPIMK